MSNSTRILGVDPGLTRCGVGVIDSASSRSVEFVMVDVFKSSPDAELSARIGSIATRIEELILAFRPQVISLERVFAQANLRSVMGTAQISGVVLALAAKYEIPIALHTPSEVKAAVTGNGRANKAQVNTMVSKILKLSEVAGPPDAADALAIAICHAWRGSSISASKSQTLTPAQKVWLEAQAAAKRNG